MRIKYDNVPDPSRVCVGDLLILPAERPESRRTRLAASSIAKFGVSMGWSGRSDNDGATVEHFIYDRCAKPLVMEVTRVEDRRAPGWTEASRRIRDNQDLLINDEDGGRPAGRVTLHYVNFDLDPEFRKYNASIGETPDEFANCELYADLVASVLRPVVNSAVVTRPMAGKPDAVSVLLEDHGMRTFPAVPHDEADSLGDSPEAIQMSQAGVRDMVVKTYVGRKKSDVVLIAGVQFLSAMVQRGAKLVRPDQRWKFSYARRIAERILLRMKENEIGVAKVLSDYANEVVSAGRTALARSKAAANAMKSLRVLADERRELDALAEGK